MIKAVIFDCFGVLTTDGWLPFADKYFVHDPALRQKATDLNKAADAGFLDYGEFLHAIAELAQLDDASVRFEIETNKTNQPLFEYIQSDLSEKFLVGVLSNAASNWMNQLFTPEQVALFDAVTLSYQIGHTKPDPQAYQAIADTLGVLPQEAVFIDDQPRYCEAAKQVGMQAIVFTDNQQLRGELATLLK